MIPYACATRRLSTRGPTARPTCRERARLANPAKRCRLRDMDIDTDHGSPPVPCDAARSAGIRRTALGLGVPRDYARARDLRAVREPLRVASIGRDIHGREQWLAPRAARAWQRMRSAAERDGIALQVVSAYRTAEYQLGIIERKLARGQSVDAILAVSAAPGYSEHHSGRAIDIT